MNLLRPKGQGTTALLDTLADTELDFIALFSSYVTQIGQPGQSDYAAANACLDEAAWARDERPIVSINWFPWTIGMAASEEYQRAARSEGDLSELESITHLSQFP